MNAIVGDTQTSQTHTDLELDNKLLNETLAILLDSRDFFSQAEKLVEDNRLNELFIHYASIRDNSCAYISNLLVARDTVPIQSGTMSGELRKLYTEFLALINDKSTRLLEQLIYHETRNENLLKEIIYRAKSNFVSALVCELADEVNAAISTMQAEFVDSTEPDEPKDENQ